MAGLSQSVERLTTEQEVAGSIPGAGPILRAQLFEGRLALNPGLNLTRASLSCVQKHFLG